LEQFQASFNTTTPRERLNLVFFEVAMVHLTRISRILHTPGGNALLVGVGGNGKQSLARLASYIAMHAWCKLSITMDYNMVTFFDDLRAIYKKAVLGKQPVTLVFTEEELKNESFFEHISTILTTGEVPGMFNREDWEAAMTDVRPLAAKEKNFVEDDADFLNNFFYSRVRDRLHLVLCMSPAGNRLRLRAQQFPAVVSACTIDWFAGWPMEALLSVAAKYVPSFEIQDSTRLVTQSLVDYFAQVHMHTSKACRDFYNKHRRLVHITSKSFLSLLDQYKRLYAAKLKALNTEEGEMQSGIAKLVEAEEVVNGMSSELASKEARLAQSQAKIEELLERVHENTRYAEMKKGEVEAEKRRADEKARAAVLLMAQANEDLTAAQPALQMALNALDKIQQQDIATVKRLQRPPQLIKRIMDCVLLIRRLPMNKVEMDPDFPGKGIFLASWPLAQRHLMADMKLLDRLKDFPKDQLNDETCELLQPYIHR
jgi:dynein heavy chain